MQNMARAKANMLGLYSTRQRDVSLVVAAAKNTPADFCGFSWVFCQLTYKSEVLLSWESMPPQCRSLEVRLDLSIHHYWLLSLSLRLRGALGFFGQDNWAGGSPLHGSMKDCTRLNLDRGWAFKLHIMIYNHIILMPVSRKNVRSPPPTVFKTILKCWSPGSQQFLAPNSIMPPLLLQTVQNRQSLEASSLRTISKKVFDVVLWIMPYSTGAIV